MKQVNQTTRDTLQSINTEQQKNTSQFHLVSKISKNLSDILNVLDSYVSNIENEGDPHA